MKVLSLLVLGLICLYSVAGEGHLFKSETHHESGFLFNRIERDSKILNNDLGLEGIFLDMSTQHHKHEGNDPRENPRSGSSSSGKDERGNRTTQDKPK